VLGYALGRQLTDAAVPALETGVGRLDLFRAQVPQPVPAQGRYEVLLYDPPVALQRGRRHALGRMVAQPAQQVLAHGHPGRVDIVAQVALAQGGRQGPLGVVPRPVDREQAAAAASGRRVPAEVHLDGPGRAAAVGLTAPSDVAVAGHRAPPFDGAGTLSAGRRTCRTPARGRSDRTARRTRDTSVSWSEA